jgi:hypothetical protein
MTEESYLTTRWLVITGVALSGLLCVLADFVFQLDSLRVPIALYGYVSLGAWSYLMGYSFRVSRGLYALPRLLALSLVMIVLPLLMLVNELEFGDIGLLASITVTVSFLALGLLHKRIQQQ